LMSKLFKVEQQYDTLVRLIAEETLQDEPQ
jgi:hypothetical protein